MKTLAVVQIDNQLNLAEGRKPAAGSTPMELPRRRLAGKPLIEWLVRRISEAQHIQGILVVLPDTAEAREIADIVPTDIPCYFSNRTTPLARLVDAIREYPCESVVRVPIENPFSDPDLIDRLVLAARQDAGYDYVGYCLENGLPAVQSHIGLFADWISCEAIVRAYKEVKRQEDNFNICQSFLNYPDIFSMRLLPVPDTLDREDLRLSVQDSEDWETLLAIVDDLAMDEPQWQDVVRAIDRNPQMRSRMAERNQA